MNTLCRCKPLLGTYVEISISADASDERLITTSSLAFDAIYHIESLMSFHNINSELSKINQVAFKNGCDISPETETVLSMCLKLSQMSNGIFDICIAPHLVNQNLLPQHGFDYDKESSYQDIILSKNHVKFLKALLIDVGGIAKGYAVDQAMNVIKQQLKGCLVDTIVNAGGDLCMYNWRDKYIEVAQSKQATKTIKMQAPAIATSGSYYLEGKSAIINPLNNKTVDLKSSISVFANSCMLADGLTKVAAITGLNHPIFKNNQALAMQL